MSKTTRKTYPPKLKMAVATDVARDERALSQVAAAQGAGGRARWADDVLAGRWLGTPRSECLRNAEHETPAWLEDMIQGFVDEYDTTRPHQSLGHATPSTWYLGGIAEAAWARMQG